MISLVITITTLNPFLLFLLVFALMFLIAFIVMMLARKAVLIKGWAPIQTPMMQLTGVFLALLLVFLANNVLKDLADAKNAVEHETNAIEKAAFLSSRLSPQERSSFLKSLESYLRLVADKEWELMQQGQEDLQARQMALSFQHQIESFAISSKSDLTDVLLTEKLIGVVQDIVIYRTNRIAVSCDLVSPVIWGMVFLQSALVMLTVALVHHENRNAQFLSLFIISSVIAATIYLIIFYDQPFANAAAGSRDTYYQLIKNIAAMNIQR